MVTEGSNEARKYFAEKGLSYADITSGEICALVLLLNRHLKIANAKHITSVDMHMSEKISCKYKSNGTLSEGFLFINSHYFTQREAISFNKDGFIGFCGWASESNTSVFVGAFKEWCDAILAAADAGKGEKG